MHNNHAPEDSGPGPLFEDGTTEPGAPEVPDHRGDHAPYRTKRRGRPRGTRPRDHHEPRADDRSATLAVAPGSASYADPPAVTTKPATQSLRAVRRKVAEISPHPLTRGLLDPRHVAKLRGDIERRGQRTPISVARDPGSGRLVVEDGHHRLAAAQQLGLSEVWVVIRDYPSSDPAVVRELTSQLLRRRSAPERAALLLRAVAEIVTAGGLDRICTDATLSRRSALGRAFEINSNLAGKLLTIAESGVAELVDRYVATPLTTVRLESLYQFAQSPRDAQLAAVQALGDALIYVTPDDVHALRRQLAGTAEISTAAHTWGQQINTRLETAHRDAANKAVARILADVEHLAAHLPQPAQDVFRRELRTRLGVGEHPTAPSRAPSPLNPAPDHKMAAGNGGPRQDTA